MKFHLFAKTAAWGIAACALLMCGCDSATEDNSADESDTAVLSSGATTISGTFSFDFDAGLGGTVVVPAGAVADVWWRLVNATTTQFAPQNGAAFAVVGVVDFKALTFEQVSTLTLSQAAIDGASLAVGTVVAYRTDAGHLGKLKVDGFTIERGIMLTWVTWAPATAITHAAHSSGSATILGTFDFDFDAGLGGEAPIPDGNTPDVFWRMAVAGDLFTPVSNAQMAVVGAVDFTGITYTQVRSLAMSTNYINRTLLPAGTVVGYRTDAGRYGKVRVDSYTGSDMHITWYTWTE